MSVLGNKLKAVLADTFSLYLKTHYYHWNIEGPDFPQYHEFLNNLYEELHAAVDPIAEHIRAIDEYAPGSYKRYEELAKVKTDEVIPEAKDMMQNLSKDNELVINSIIEAMQEAGKNPRTKGIENFMQDRLDIHMKHGWMLRSILKK
jgi:starvation-inducible DNA-binding protein